MPKDKIQAALPDAKKVTALLDKPSKLEFEVPLS